jgi:DNA-binding MarR family transcriptional regulator
MEYQKKLNEQRPKASPLTLLEILARQAGPSLPLFDLQAQSGMDPSRYAEALKSLRDAGYITVEGEALEQVVRLTDRGADVVRLARPAFFRTSLFVVRAGDRDVGVGPSVVARHCSPTLFRRWSRYV